MGGQSYVERPPIPALAGVVSSVWIQQVAPDAPPYVQRNIPSGGVELVCRLGREPRVVGPLTGALVEVLEPGTTVVGLRLAPGAAARVLGLPASELVDLAVDAHDVWGAAGGGRFALADLADPDASPERLLARIQLLVAARLADAAAPDPLVAEAVGLLRWSIDDVASLTASLHISERQLRRRFQTATGLAPKPLHRVLRFQRFHALAQHAIASGAAPAEDGIARLAAEAGYADQPHLNRECVRLTGASPGAFLGEAEDHCGCGHDHAASFVPVLRARPMLV
ncbi:MAG TPA: helix-turn-helix transcriptional regulator [Solirubrobacteraceae bacterium]|nr:helix-turn-helix transcriptional regulator [Solirubrobacteraceae bacterium]